MLIFEPSLVESVPQGATGAVNCICASVCEMEVRHALTVCGRGMNAADVAQKLRRALGASFDRADFSWGSFQVQSGTPRSSLNSVGRPPNRSRSAEQHPRLAAKCIAVLRNLALFQHSESSACEPNRESPGCNRLQVFDFVSTTQEV